MKSMTALPVVALLSALAMPPAMAGSNACATILCLGGSMDGGSDNGQMCDKPIQDYFDIKEYRGGEYDPGLTLQSRIDYLDECPEDTTTKMRINAKYGMIPDNPGFQ